MISLILGAAVLSWIVTLLFLVINLARIPRLGAAIAPGTNLPRVSVIVPARNEEEKVGAAVASQLAQEYPDYEVIVVNDCSRDRTGEILAALPDPESRLRVIVGTEPPPGWLGKPNALATGSRAASGDLLLFADADVLYHPRTLSEAVAALDSMRADFLCLLPRMEGRGFWENVLMPNVMGSVFLGAGFLANLDWPRWLAAGGGGGNLIRRAAYQSLGGHTALKDSVVDDVRLAFDARRAGFRTRVLRAEHRISVRMYDGFREVWDGFTKNVAYIFNGAWGALLMFLSLLVTVFAIAPAAALLAAAAGLPLEARQATLAATAVGLMILARVTLAVALGDPVWPSFFHPLMAAVWAGIIGRSLYHRVVRRRLSWRGRDFDARGARF